MHNKSSRIHHYVTNMFHRDKCTNMEYSVTNANINYNITTNYNKKNKNVKKSCTNPHWMYS